MSTPPTGNLVKWWPSISSDPSPSETSLHTRLLFNTANDHDQAITLLKGQIDNLTAGAQTIITNISGGGSPAPPTPPFAFPGLGGVNDISSNLTYTTSGTDNGILLILNNASGTAVTLNSGVTTPFFLFTTNLGTVGNGTFTPNSGLINGSASFTLNPLYTSIMQFDGTNWHATALPIVPTSIAKVTHEWLDSYDASTGAFTQSQPAYSDISGTPTLPSSAPATPSNWINSYTAGTGVFTETQPAFSDISGNLATSQLPAAGLSVVIITAALTLAGTQGSMTFTNGILTAQTPAT